MIIVLSIILIIYTLSLGCLLYCMKYSTVDDPYELDEFYACYPGNFVNEFVDVVMEMDPCPDILVHYDGSVVRVYGLMSKCERASLRRKLSNVSTGKYKWETAYD